MKIKSRYYIASGIIAGIMGLLIFLIIHYFTITPIWFILPVGILLAAGGGAAVGWAFAELRSHLLANAIWSALLLAGMLTLTQVPGFLIGQRFGPVVDIQTESILQGMTTEIVRRFVFDLIFMAGFVGGLLGWLVGRTRRAAVAMATAGMGFAVGPGHNIPFFVGIGFTAAGKMLVIMAMVILASGFTLGICTYWFENR
jgi:hypothetical protein